MSGAQIHAERKQAAYVFLKCFESCEIEKAEADLVSSTCRVLLGKSKMAKINAVHVPKTL